MTKAFRGAVPLLVVALALANTGCGSKSSERSATSPTSSRPTAFGDEGRVTSMAAPPLGVFQQFSVLANAGVTAVGAALVNADVGSCPTAAGAQPAGMIVTPPGVYRQPGNDAVSCQAQADVTAAVLNLNAQGPGTLIGAQLNTVNTGNGVGVLLPGVYSTAAAADIATTTTLTLNGAGSYVFLIGSTITANTLSNVVLINGASACDVFWRVNMAANLMGFNFPGTVIAGTAVTLDGGSNTVNIGAAGIPGGRVVSRTAAVTMPGNFQKTLGGPCVSAFPPPAAPTPTPAPGGPVPALPAAAAWGLLAILLASGAFVLSRH